MMIPLIVLLLFVLETKVSSKSAVSIQKLEPRDRDSQLLYDWIHRGMFDAIKKKYLKKIIFSLHSMQTDDILEAYSFNIDYGSNVLIKAASGRKKRKFNVSNDNNNSNSNNNSDNIRITERNAIRRAQELVRNIVAITTTFEHLLDNDQATKNFYFEMRFLYHKNCPKDYQPPMFSQAEKNDKIQLKFKHEPYQQSIGSLNTQYHQTSLFVKTIMHNHSKLKLTSKSNRRRNKNKNKRRNENANDRETDENSIENDIHSDILDGMFCFVKYN